MEGLPRITVIKIGQHILIEGEDEDNPYVAKVIRLFGDGESRSLDATLDATLDLVPCGHVAESLSLSLR